MTQHTPPRFRGFQGPNYTQVPDAVFDELLPDLSGAELKVLLYVIRRTFGFKRESDHISLSQMLHGIRTRDGRELDRGVGLTKKTLLAAINSLEDQGIILTERRRSVDHGDEPTTYRLNVIDAPRGVETTPPVGDKVHQGGGGEIPPGPWRKNSPTQETGLQETGRQQTEAPEYSSLSPKPDVSLSKFRKGTPGKLGDQGPEHKSTILPQSSPPGFASVASVLSAATYPTGGRAGRRGAAETERRGMRAARQEPAPASVTTGRQDTTPASAVPASEQPRSRTEQPTSSRKPRRVAAASTANQSVGHSEDRERVAAYIRDFGLEFHDRASAKASVTRALRLLSESGYPRERWSEKLYEARGLTKERSAAIGYEGNGRPRTGIVAGGAINKMPYYFELLACVLGLHDHPAGQHPMPLTEQEFKRQQGRAADPERKSLAGRYAHLVRR